MKPNEFVSPRLIGRRRILVSGGSLLAGLSVGLSSCTALVALTRGAWIPSSPPVQPLESIALPDSRAFLFGIDEERWVRVRPKGSLLDTSALICRRLPEDLAIARDVGFRNVRVYLLWEQIEPYRDQIDFSIPDRQLGSSATRGLRFLFTLAHGNPAYDGRYRIATAEALSAYKRYAEAVVRRYGHLAAGWQIWNEPNDPNQFFNGGDPVGYARLVREVTPVIRRLQPKTFIVAGSVSRIDGMFLIRMFSADIGTAVDAIGVHPYRWPAPETVFVDMPSLQAVTGDYQIAFSEWGYATYLNPAESPVTAELQASYAVRLLLIGHVLESPSTVWYEASDSGTDRTYSEDNYGLVDSSLRPKPAYAALKTLFARVGHQRADAIYRENGLFLVRFPARPGAGNRMIVWNEQATSLPMYLREGVSVSSITGANPMTTTAPTTVLVPPTAILLLEDA